MAAPPPSATKFRFGLGDISLELLATLAGRFRDPFDRFATPRDLDRWLIEAGLLHEAYCGKTDLTHARELREAIYRVIEAARHDQHPANADVALINRWARKPTPAPQLGPHLNLISSAADPISAALAHIARSAVELLSGPDRDQVRNCADPTCSLLFIDRSRPGRRRWCSMDSCGNKDKTARYRHHRREPKTRPIPAAATQVERSAVEDATRAAGARRAFLIEEPLAAAIGADLPVGEALGALVVDVRASNDC